MFGKKTIKDFETWYNGVDNGSVLTSVKAMFEQRPYLPELQQLILAGHKLTKKDVARFWELFHEAQRDAFNAGSK